MLQILDLVVHVGINIKGQLQQLQQLQQLYNKQQLLYKKI
jgi:hypothetical protein